MRKRVVHNMTSPSTNSNINEKIIIWDTLTNLRERTILASRPSISTSSFSGFPLTFGSKLLCQEVWDNDFHKIYKYFVIFVKFSIPFPLWFQTILSVRYWFFPNYRLLLPHDGNSTNLKKRCFFRNHREFQIKQFKC